MKLAILDDYQHVALKMADWSGIAKHCQIDVIDRPLQVPDEATRVLAPYDIICMLRERTAGPRSLIEKLSNLKLLAITGSSHRTLDMAAATERGILVCHSTAHAGAHQGTPELTIGLIFAAIRNIPREDRLTREGRWQNSLGIQVFGRTLGIVGLGKIGRKVARVAQALDMKVIAWSQNLTSESAAEAGVTRVDKDELFARSDIVTLHLVLGDRTRGIVGAHELSLMKPTAYIVNTARGPLIDEQALIAALQRRQIVGAALDVFWQEPIPANHPLLSMENVVLTPHLGYVVEESYRAFYGDIVEAVMAWLDGKPIRVLNPEALAKAGA
ncbi:MAG: D-2-hydroxyacid dehydrogenase family protein [Xanthobacteraceae bacterium]